MKTKISMTNRISTPKNSKEGRLFSEKVLTENGFDFSFIGSSESNGVSVYFRVGDLKVRFSDHSVTNKDRVMNEVHFSFSDNENNKQQSILKLKYLLGDKSVEHSVIDYVRFDGKILKGFGYKKINN